MIYKYSQLLDSQRISYDESRELCVNAVSMHLGQLKLFFSELIFLTKYCQLNDRILYIGAAPGYHIIKLVELFPNVNFDLWDPRDFDIKEGPNIKIYQKYFTDSNAHAYSQINNRILLMCDIRTMKIGTYQKIKETNKIDILVEDDMKMQMKWCQIIKPVYAYLKFRLPYEIPETKYLGGTIYLQPYSPLSTETRLMTNNYNNLIEYDVNKFNDKMSYFNAYIRCLSHYDKWKNIMDTYHLVNNWDNTLALYIIAYYLKIVRNIRSEEEIGKLFMDIIKFHIDKYGSKYDVLFENI